MEEKSEENFSFSLKKNFRTSMENYACFVLYMYDYIYGFIYDFYFFTFL